MSLEQLAAVTRLNIEFITALEEGRRDRLPGQVYLKPFTKTCAEALGLDLKELYRIIDGESGEGPKENQIIAEPLGQKKRRDYKLPIVLSIAVIISFIIFFAIKTRDKMPVKTEIVEVIPAAADLEKTQVRWSRPWERPALVNKEITAKESILKESVAKESIVKENTVKVSAVIENTVKQSLVLTATDNVEVNVVSAGDTLFNGVFTAGVRKVFTSDSVFLLNLSRNDCVNAFINGQKDLAVGSSRSRLINYSIGRTKH